VVATFSGLPFRVFVSLAIIPKYFRLSLPLILLVVIRAYKL